ncbi:hypothetical protein WA026_016440 [Henosepilachna vigintioctopunctata]|uniref:Protein halfway n=1 Tax=Henosepilachna vigintioctopunctata TaxID=420089 RepID=A0AAW1UNZ7_9CUCU
MNFNCFLLIIQFFMFPICFGRLEEDTSYNNTTNEVCDFNKCFHKSVDFCPSAESPCRCHQLPKCRRAVVCCNVNSFQMKEGLACANVSDGIVEALHIRNATLDELNVSLPIWKRLRYMTISDGNIRSVIGEFSKLTFMSCLNLSSNSISKFDERSLVMLYNLSYLDLSNNNLTEIPRFKKEGPVTLDISHNDFIQCNSVTETLKRAELFFNNGNKTTCTAPKTFDWFNSTEHVPLIQMKGLQELNDECSRLKYNCSCAPLRLDIIIGTGSIFAIEVNCSNRGLTKLPSVLPPNTVSLNVRNNNITSLEAINNNPSYSHLRQLYADNNKIDSVLPLEGSDFLYQFITLNLTSNKIKSVSMIYLRY